MTAKQKADKLIERFRIGIKVKKYFLKHNPYNMEKAKECALICVEEIMNENYDNNVHADVHGLDGDGGHITNEIFWEDVKNELLKL